jgi:hypothetical protein
MGARVLGVAVLAALLSASTPAWAARPVSAHVPDAAATTDVRGSGVVLLGASGSSLVGAEASAGFGSGPLRLHVGAMGLSAPAFDLGPGSLQPVIVAANFDLCAGAFAVDIYSRLCLGGSGGTEHMRWHGFASPSTTMRPWGGVRLGYAYTRWLTPQVGLEAGIEAFVPVVGTHYRARMDDGVVDQRGPWRVGMLLRFGVVLRSLGSRR